MNVEKPNSPNNIHVIGCYKGHDSSYNLRSAFGTFTAEIDSIKNLKLQWIDEDTQEKSLCGIQLFLFGVVATFWKKMQKECIEHDLGNERSDKKTNANQLLKDKSESCLATKQNLDEASTNLKTIQKVVKAMKKVAKGKCENLEESDEDSKNEECGSIICICNILDCLEENLQWLRCDFCMKWYHCECLIIVTEEDKLKEVAAHPWKCLSCKENVKEKEDLLNLAMKKIDEYQTHFDTAKEKHAQRKEEFKRTEELLKFGRGATTTKLEKSLDELKIDRLAYHSGTFVEMNEIMTLKFHCEDFGSFYSLYFSDQTIFPKHSRQSSPKRNPFGPEIPKTQKSGKRATQKSGKRATRKKCGTTFLRIWAFNAIVLQTEPVRSKNSKY
uniref:Zinc finger PHD-type domain-containing protein n=1 Tax=Romanomermis culicivorax TaxID=13658 RepID=A0A915IED0_ROMCU